MTEESNSQTAAAPDRPVQSQTLRQAREAAGLQVAALAAMLKVPVERLLALEEGRYQDLPNLTFARALASSVCRVLKIDPAPVLLGLPQLADVRLGHESSIQSVVEMPRRRVLPGLPRLDLHSPLVWAVLLLLLAVALWWWLPQPDSGAPLQSHAEPRDQAPAAVVETVVSPAPASQALAGTAAPVDAASPAQPAEVQAVPPVSPAPAAPAQPAPATVAVPAVTEAVAVRPAQSAPPQPLLQLRARAVTWVQLRDASGKELQQKTLQPGQALDYDGPGPVQVVLGRTSGVDVIVHGQPFDTSSFASNRVARFEVK